MGHPGRRISPEYNDFSHSQFGEKPGFRPPVSTRSVFFRRTHGPDERTAETKREFFSKPLHPVTAATEYHDKGHKKNEQENVEQNLVDCSGRGRSPVQSEERSHERYDQKRVAQIKRLLPPAPVETR